jgi:hypothetical protein
MRHDPCLQELCTLWPRDAHWEKWRQVKDGVRLLPTPPNSSNIASCQQLEVIDAKLEA